MSNKSIDTDEHVYTLFCNLYECVTFFWTVNKSNTVFLYSVLLCFSIKICQDYFLHQSLLVYEQKVFGYNEHHVVGNQLFRQTGLNLHQHSRKYILMPEIMFNSHTRTHARIRTLALTQACIYRCIKEKKSGAPNQSE